MFVHNIIERTSQYQLAIQAASLATVATPQLCPCTSPELELGQLRIHFPAVWGSEYLSPILWYLCQHSIQQFLFNSFESFYSSLHLCESGALTTLTVLA